MSLAIVTGSAGLIGSEASRHFASQGLTAIGIDKVDGDRPNSLPLVEVYNIGGSQFSNCSMLEAIQICEDVLGQKLNHSYQEVNRTGNHIGYVSDFSKFFQNSPQWRLTKNIHDILSENFDANASRWETVNAS